MRLLSINANKSSFRPVKFNYNGLSFVVAKHSKQDSTEKGKTYNGVGKSILISIIHFCLGASEKHYKSFCKELPDWEFFLEFEAKLENYTARRGTNNPGVIYLNNNELRITKFNDILEKLCFDMPEEIKYLSFRSLLPFFIRPYMQSYVSYDQSLKVGSDYQKMLNNAFLLGLDLNLAQEKLNYKKEKDRVKTLTDNIKNDELLKNFFAGSADPQLAAKDLDDKISKVETDIKYFRVADDYYEVKWTADRIEKDLTEINNNVVLLGYQIENIDKSLKVAPEVGTDGIEKIYAEAGILFPDQVTYSLEQVKLFYESLIKNRQKRLTEQKRRIEKLLKSKTDLHKQLRNDLDRMLQYLGAHQALDVFVKVTQRLSDLRMKKDNLIKYDKLIAEYHNTDLEIREEMLEAVRRTDSYLEDSRAIIDGVRDFFRSLAKQFYPEASSGITVYNNEGENQIRYNIDARIDADASDGINHVKIFCYDLTLLFKGYGHNMNFVFHDSRLFDGIDEIQKTALFRIVAEMFTNNKQGHQYIASINQNQLEEIKRYLKKDEYENIIEQNTVLVLTDQSDSEKLLGIKVDIKYEE